MQICFERLIEGIKQKQKSEESKNASINPPDSTRWWPNFLLSFLLITKLQTLICCMCLRYFIAIIPGRPPSAKQISFKQTLPLRADERAGKIDFLPIPPNTLTRPHAGQTSNVQNTFWYYDTAMCLSKKFRASSPRLPNLSDEKIA